jgi:4-oxalomesaconate tautomerase
MQPQPTPIAISDFSPTVLGSLPHMPVYHMRGGTSTGIVLWEGHLPKDLSLREELIRHLMGVPLTGEVSGNRQITGLGRGPATSNKVFIVDRPTDSQADINSTLAQLAADRSSIDWRVNCGNMSAALPLYAIDTGLIAATQGETRVRIYNTNTRVMTDARMPYPFSSTEIPGVIGRFPAVELSLRQPVGAKTGALFPTGKRIQMFDGIEATCLDVAVPMVILRAADLGCTGDESIDVLNANKVLIERLRSIWVQAGLAMGLKRSDGTPMSAEDLAVSETIPKICMVAPDSGAAHLKVRYFTPQSAHASMAVTGGCCLAVAALIEGTVAHGVAQGLPSLGASEGEHLVNMSNPAGVLQARVCGQVKPEAVEIPWVAYTRSTQILLKGFTPIYQATPELSAYFQAYKA